MGLAKVGQAFLNPPVAPVDGSLWYFDAKWGWRPTGSALTFDGTQLTGSLKLNELTNTQVCYGASDGSIGQSSNLTYASGTGLTISNATASSSTSTGALVVTGGVGIGGAINIGTTLRLGNGSASPSLTSDFYLNTTGNAVMTMKGNTEEMAFGATTASFFGTRSSTDLYIQRGGTNMLQLTSSSLTTLTGTASASTTTGDIVVGGGIGIGGAIYGGSSLSVLTSARIGSNTAFDADVTNAFGTPTVCIVDNNNSQDGFVSVANGNNAVGAHFYGAKTRGSGTDANTIIQSADELMSFGAWAADGVQYRPAAFLKMEADGSPGAASIYGRLTFFTNNGGTSINERMRISAAGNVLVGTAAIATNATDGFLYIPTCAGAPTGTPTAFTGRVPMIYDTTNNNFYFYNGAWKKTTTFA